MENKLFVKHHIILICFNTSLTTLSGYVEDDVHTFIFNENLPDDYWRKFKHVASSLDSDKIKAEPPEKVCCTHYTHLYAAQVDTEENKHFAMDLWPSFFHNKD